MISSQLTRRPISIYVSMDTIRDYLFAPDCAQMILDATSLRGRSGQGRYQMKIFASQRGTTIGAVVRELRRVLKRPPRTGVRCPYRTSRMQVRDLRFRSIAMPWIDARADYPPARRLEDDTAGPDLIHPEASHAEDRRGDLRVDHLIARRRGMRTWSGQNS